MREVEARLKLSAIDKTGNVLSKVGKQMADVNRRAIELNRQQGLLAKSSAAAFAAIARFAAPAVLAYGIKQSLVDFAAVERQMSRIGITAGATKDETAAAFETMQQEAKQMAMPLADAMKALDTLVSSGMDLKQAMEFLPSVLATAQASGADTADIANTAIKAASALKLEAKEMQRAFDIMVEGGKAGQFELKDMAAYIPDLANSFASLGYTGEDGLKKLIAMMQTVREDTGSSEAAATNLQNIFGKIYSEDTATKFKKMGIDLNAEMEKAKKNGEDTVAAFVRISNEAIKGDLTKLPRLFTDQQFRMGMQSLMTSADSYQKFLKAVNDSKVDGTVFRDLKRVTDDTQASIDRLSSSWDKLMRSVGESSSRVLVPAMDAMSNNLDYDEAINRGLEKQGIKGFLDREWAKYRMGSRKEADLTALAGGYKDDALAKKYRTGPDLPAGWVRPSNVVNGVPIPGERPTTNTRTADAVYDLFARGREIARSVGDQLPSRRLMDEAALNNFYGGAQNNEVLRSRIMKRVAKHQAPYDDRRSAMQAARDGDGADAAKIAASLEDGSQKIAEGGNEAGQKLIQAAQEAGRALASAVAQAAAALSNIKVNVNAPRVNADTGKSNTFVNSPANFGPK